MLTISTASLLAQEPLKADAGPNRNFCYDIPYNADSVYLGGQPSAIGGKPPYSYTWTANYNKRSWDSIKYYSASDFLSDTSIANPEMVFTHDEFEKLFFLTVRDSEGNTALDSTIVTTSTFHEHLMNWGIGINQGDSILLYGGNNIDALLQPATYLWRPNHGLRDSTSKDGWAKPEHSGSYHQVVTDSAGCSRKGGNVYTLAVVPTSVNNLIEVNQLELHFQSNENIIRVKSEYVLHYTLSILNTQGQVVLAQTLSGDGFVEVNHLAVGVYIAQLTENGNPIKQLKFVVER